jgi:hypothetical protein
MESSVCENKKEEEISNFVSWQEITPRNQIFEGIHGHSTIKYGNDLWIFGGKKILTIVTDLKGARHGWALNQLSSFDLERHEYRVVYPLILERENVVLTHCELPYVSDHSATTYNDKMYIFGNYLQILQ